MKLILTLTIDCETNLPKHKTIQKLQETICEVLPSIIDDGKIIINSIEI